MKRTTKIVLGILIYLLFMVVLFPAKVAVALAPLPVGVSLGGVSGSVWQGQAALLQFGNRQLQQLSWDINPWRLLIGQLQLDLQLGSRGAAVNGKAQVQWSFSGVSAQGFRLDAPVSFLVGEQKLPFRTVLSGDVSLLLDEAAQGQPWCQTFNGKLFLNQLGIVNQFGQYPLGNIEFALQCVAGQIQLATDDQKNSIGVAGTVLLKDQLQLEVNGRMRRTDSQSKDLQDALGLLGKPDNNGNYPLNYRGRIPGL